MLWPHHLQLDALTTENKEPVSFNGALDRQSAVTSLLPALMAYGLVEPPHDNKGNDEIFHRQKRWPIPNIRDDNKDQQVDDEVDSKWFQQEDKVSKFVQDDIEKKLLKQLIESEIDSKWLIQEENVLKKRLSHIHSNKHSDTNANADDKISSQTNIRCDWSQNSNSLNKISRPNSPGFHALTQNANFSPGLTKYTTEGISASDEVDEDNYKVSEFPKMQKLPEVMDRSNDEVYAATISVVRAIMALSQGVEKACAAEYLNLVRYVGIELRNLLVSVDKLSSQFPPQVHREVEMAHQVLSKDMHELVLAMRLAQQYNETTLDVEYRKSMLSAAHILAMDAKNLFDVIDSIRARYVTVTQCHQKLQSSIQTKNVQSDELSKPNDSSQKDDSPSQNYQFSSAFSLQPSHTNEEGYQIMSKDTYEDSIIVNNRTPISHQVSSSTSIGLGAIYDNECVISEQGKDVEPNLTNSTSNEYSASTDIGAHFSEKYTDNFEIANKSKEHLDESLKIVEENTHLYCNLSITSGTEQLVHN